MLDETGSAAVGLSPQKVTLVDLASAVLLYLLGERESVGTRVLCLSNPAV
jgi:hypothetical protein